MEPYLKHFNYRYASVFGVAFWFAGVGAMLADKYTAATWFYIIGAVWILGWWVSENRPRKRHFGWSHTHLWLLTKTWLVPILIFGTTAFFVFYTQNLKLHHELEQLQGFLFPANDPDPPTFCNHPDTLKIFLGPSEGFAYQFPSTIIRVRGRNMVILDKDADGKLVLSADILGEDSKVIATFENGIFTIVQGNILDMKRPDRSTVIVRDQYKNEVLNVRYLNTSSVRLSGIIRNGGRKIIIPPARAITGFCGGGSAETVFDFP